MNNGISLTRKCSPLPLLYTLIKEVNSKDIYCCARLKLCSRNSKSFCHSQCLSSFILPCSMRQIWETNTLSHTKEIASGRLSSSSHLYRARFPGNKYWSTTWINWSTVQFSYNHFSVPVRLNVFVLAVFDKDLGILRSKMERNVFRVLYLIWIQTWENK